MRACEIPAAANELLGRPLRWSSVKGILSAYTLGGTAASDDSDEASTNLAPHLSDLRWHRVRRPPRAGPRAVFPRDTASVIRAAASRGDGATGHSREPRANPMRGVRT